MNKNYCNTAFTLINSGRKGLSSDIFLGYCKTNFIGAKLKIG